MARKSSIPVPPHMLGAGAEAPGDPGGHFPDGEKAAAYAAGAVESAYGADRLRAVRHLLSSIAGEMPEAPVVLDFGGGDGAFLHDLGLHPSSVFMVDVSPHMLELVPPRFPSVPLRLMEGSVETLVDLDTGTVDLVVAANAMNYLSPADRRRFLEEVGRLLRPGGHFIALVGNELIDLFALNAGTAAFFRREFSSDVGGLLTDSEVAVWRNADRENPLRLGSELRDFGLREIGQAFSQWHELPPGLAVREAGGDVFAARSASRNHEFDPNTMPLVDRWQALFRCSMFASLSVRDPDLG